VLCVLVFASSLIGNSLQYIDMSDEEFDKHLLSDANHQKLADICASIWCVIRFVCLGYLFCCGFFSSHSILSVHRLHHCYSLTTGSRPTTSISVSEHLSGHERLLQRVEVTWAPTRVCGLAFCHSLVIPALGLVLQQAAAHVPRGSLWLPLSLRWRTVP
jgi:hypothetical protein